MSNELKGGDAGNQFDYKDIDGDTAQFLQACADEIEETLGQAATRIGGILSKAQVRLSGNRYNGVFGKWLEHVGYPRTTAHELIHRYKAVVRIPNAGRREIFESLPLGLSKQVSAPSAESTPAKAQAKAEVLAGDITTGKAYKDRIAELEAQLEEKDALNKKTQEQRDAEQRERERLEVENSELAERKPEVRTEYIEKEVVKTEIVDNTPDDYEEVKQRLESYTDKFGDLSNYDSNVTATHRQDMIVAVMSMSRGVREFIKRYEYMKQYKGVIDNLDEQSIAQYNEAVTALKGMADSFEYAKEHNIVIDAEYSEII